MYETEKIVNCIIDLFYDEWAMET